MNKMLKYALIFTFVATAVLSLLAIFADVDLTDLIILGAVLSGPIIAIGAVSVLAAGTAKNISIINNPRISQPEKQNIRRRFLIVLAWIVIPIILYWVVFLISLAFQK